MKRINIHHVRCWSLCGLSRGRGRGWRKRCGGSWDIDCKKANSTTSGLLLSIADLWTMPLALFLAYGLCETADRHHWWWLRKERGGLYNQDLVKSVYLIQQIKYMTGIPAWDPQTCPSSTGNACYYCSEDPVWTCENMLKLIWNSSYLKKCCVVLRIWEKDPDKVENIEATVICIQLEGNLSRKL